MFEFTCGGSNFLEVIVEIYIIFFFLQLNKLEGFLQERMRQNLTPFGTKPCGELQPNAIEANALSCLAMNIELKSLTYRPIAPDLGDPDNVLI